MTTLFARRPRRYKLGMALLFVGVVLYILGFSSPSWYKLTSGMVHVHGGLWQTCVKVLMLRMCSATPRGSVASDWMSIVQGLQCIGLAGLLVAGIYGMIINWLQKNPRYTRLLETCGIFSSVLGVTSGVIYIGQTESSMGMATGSLPVHVMAVVSITHSRHTVSWGLCVALAGSALSLVASVIIGIYNSSPLPVIAEETASPDVIACADPEVGGLFAVIDPGTHAVYYIPGQSTASSPESAIGPRGFYQKASEFRPPPSYESVVAPPPPSSQYPKN